MKKVLMSVMLAGIFSAFLVNFAIAHEGSATDPDVQKELSSARRATAKYLDVSVAEADGYVSRLHCVENMGVHYVNSSLQGNFEVDPLTPQVLLYIPTKNGKMRLLGAEYTQAITDPDDPRESPILFGQKFHVSLHVYLWEGNPDGIFEEYNPNVSCW